MRSSRWTDAAQAARVALRPPVSADRRLLLGALLAAPLALPAPARANAQTLTSALRTGGVVVAMRHALAPGTFDPPNFRLGDCSTQRNLSDDGRAQARRVGGWFASRQLAPAAVRSSPWCRCVDTAQLAFGRAEVWAALGSPRGSNEQTNETSLRELRRAVRETTAQAGRLEVWVTHMFVLSPLTGRGATSGEGLLLQADAQGAVRVLGSIDGV